jgi:GDPmannose 4,6-dehydratase
MTRALICGISGQDGALLAKHLLDKGYTVVGTSRDAEISGFNNLIRMGIRDHVRCVSMTLTDFRSVLQTLIDSEPAEIYNLAGQSSVGLSFAQPVETLESITSGTLNLLESIRFLKLPAKLYSAGSSECFGDRAAGEPADEETAFRPRSPYGVAKAAAFWMVANYREAYGLFASSGILFNHESPLRPARFVTRKIVAAANRIALGSDEALVLGDLGIVRDWGWAPEYVDAMWRMLQLEKPEDFVIGSGSSHSLEEFVSIVFARLDLDWRDHVRTDKTLLRAAEIRESRADPRKAFTRLAWRAEVGFEDLVSRLVAAERAPMDFPGLR